MSGLHQVGHLTRTPLRYPRSVLDRQGRFFTISHPLDWSKSPNLHFTASQTGRRSEHLKGYELRIIEIDRARKPSDFVEVLL